MGSYMGSKVPKIIKNHQKIAYFSHNLGIKAISPMHGIKFIIGTYTIVPKKIIIYMLLG